MSMWENLPEDQKEYYKKLILNFASISEVFYQKNVGNQEKEKKKNAPIVNSKFQETVFQRSFRACAEDIGNTSYDASLIVNKKKYLVGLKTFGIDSGDQKIAQFKRAQVEYNWSSIFNQIRTNSEGLKGKKQIDKKNKELYKQLAIKISKVRNQRLESSKSNLKGFNEDTDSELEAVYHYLMPSIKEGKPKIFVGEVPYYDIDIANITIEGCTSSNTPMNFKFNDGRHKYKYTYADSQLYMTFENTSLEEWDVHYVEDPFSIFEEMDNILPSRENSQVENEKQLEVIDTVSWKINIQRRSGFNQFMGLFKSKEESIQRCINDVKNNFSGVAGTDELIEELKRFKMNYKSMESLEKYSTREKIMEICRKIDNSEMISEEQSKRKLIDVAMKHLFRSSNEMYIPIPNSKQFHNTRPNFFGTGIAKLNGKKLMLPKDERLFNLKFLPSNAEIMAYINQEGGKAIQSKKKQGVLGEWILKQVFQLSEYEPLSYKRLSDLEINGIRLSKFSDADNHIGLEFIWIDDEQLPDDYWK